MTHHITDDHLRTLAAMSMLARTGPAPLSDVARSLGTTEDAVRESAEQLERYGLTTQSHGERPQWMPTAAGRRRAARTVLA